MNMPLTSGVIELAKRLSDSADHMAEQREVIEREANELRERWNRRSIMKGPGNEVL